MEKILGQQGDCLLIKSKTPKGAKHIPLSGKRFVLLKGEGVNTHELMGEKLSESVQAYELDGVLYLKVLEPVNLVHSEHGTDQIPPGTYRRQIEREFDYEADEARNVRD